MVNLSERTGLTQGASPRRVYGMVAGLAVATLLFLALSGVTYEEKMDLNDQPAELDLVDPDGVNPQTLVDSMNDIKAEETSSISKVRNIMRKLHKLADKRLSIIVDTQTLKKGGRPGAPGPQGKKGKPGYQGPPGAEGNRGPQGFKGPRGDQGRPGTRGFRGKTGDTGGEGLKGPVGVVGPDGFAGPPGPRGPLGVAGPRGRRGPRGQSGYSGGRGAPGMTGMKGMRGPKGAIHVIDIAKLCQEKGGQLYQGICLVSVKINNNRDDVPRNCHSYQPWMWWGWHDYIKIRKMIAGNRYDNPHIYGWGHGGRCTNFRAVLSFTRYNGNNHVWVRYGTFHWSPHHYRSSRWCRWWWGWRCWTYHWQYCHLYSGGNALAVYACRV